MEDEESPTKWGLHSAAYYSVIFLIVDNLLFNVVLNLTSILIAAEIGDMVNVTYLIQICIVVVVVIAAYMAVFSLGLEKDFWQLLFSPDQRYRYVLWMREIFNILSLLFFLNILFGWDIKMSCARENFMNLLYSKVNPNFPPYGIKTSCDTAKDVEQAVRMQKWMSEATWWERMIYWSQDKVLPRHHPPPVPELSGSSPARPDLFEVFLAVGGITGCVIKAMHFGILQSYIKALLIFGDIYKETPSWSDPKDECAPHISEESVPEPDPQQPELPDLQQPDRPDLQQSGDPDVQQPDLPDLQQSGDPGLLEVVPPPKPMKQKARTDGTILSMAFQ